MPQSTQSEKPAISIEKAHNQVMPIVALGLFGMILSVKIGISMISESLMTTGDGSITRATGLIICALGLVFCIYLVWLADHRIRQAEDFDNWSREFVDWLSQVNSNADNS